MAEVSSCKKGPTHGKVTRKTSNSMSFDRQVACTCSVKKRSDSINIGSVLLGIILQSIILVAAIVTIIFSFAESDMVFTGGSITVLLLIIAYDIASFSAKFRKLHKAGHSNPCARRISLAATFHSSPVF